MVYCPKGPDTDTAAGQDCNTVFLDPEPRPVLVGVRDAVVERHDRPLRADDLIGAPPTDKPMVIRSGFTGNVIHMCRQHRRIFTRRAHVTNDFNSNNDDLTHDPYRPPM
jgi:hypothetical protein